MPQKTTIERARRAKRGGKRATTQAGEFVREEMEHVKRGKHGARSSRQAVAIGLSKARRAGVDLPPPGRGQAKEKTRRSAASAYRKGQQEGPLSSRRGARSGRGKAGGTRRASTARKPQRRSRKAA